MNKVLLTSLAALALAGCSKTTSNLASTSPQVPSSKLVLTDASGCLLDEDCAAGLFCFQNRCTFECAADVPCGPGEHCSASGRCLSDAKEALVWKGTELTPVAWDEAEAAAAPGTTPISVLSPPPQEVQVIAGAPFVEVSLETSAPLPDGALLYRVALEGVSGTQQSLRATGSTRFTLTIPTGTAGTLDATPTVQRANVVTSVGAFAIALVPRRSVDGLYAGDVAVREFGGSSVPLRFGLRVVPSDATFEDAQQRFLILPASPQALFSPIVSNTEVWVERPLEFDTQSNVWFARFAAPFALDGNSQFGGDIVRTLRIELSGMEEGRLQGAVADRWLGLFAARTADGVPTPATVGLTGQLTATRVQALPAAARTPMQGNASATTPSLAAPLAITQCTSTVYGSLVAGTGQLTDAGVATGPCPGMTTPTSFTSAATEDKATCALALADKALAGPSTATQVLAFLDENTPNPGGLSFGEFLTKCAARDGYCVPTPEVLCANQLLAHAYQTQAAELTQAGVLLERYQRTAREVYLGRQLAAFQVDTNIRLEWLRTSEAPLFLASELKAYNEDILARWKTQVLDAHFDVLRSQFAPAGLEVLGRQPTDATALSVRGQMLLEQAQTWQGAMEALQIATTRWNSLYQDTSSRASATALVRSRMFDLYLSAAVLSQLNRASGASANSSIFGSGFAALMRSLEQLSLPFDSLIFMRDAEVVVNRSVDPSSSANTLLADRRELARRAVLDAQDSVDRVLADSRASEINAQVLTDRMITQAEELRSELVQVCGLPRGCTTTDFAARPECAVNVSVGSCGFVRAPNGGAVDPILAIAAEPSISEAGQAILAFRQSLIDQQIAQEEFRGNQERAQIELDAAEGFAKKIESWDRQRRAVNTEVQTLLNEITSLNIETMNEEIAGLKAMQLRREAAYDVQEAGVRSWAAIRYAGVTADMKKMTSINALNQTGAWLTRTADEVDHLAETTAEGFPKAVGLANDVSFAGRFIIGMSAFGVTSGLRAAATALDTAAASVELSLTEDRARREANLEELADLADLQVRQTENQLAEMSTQLRVHALQTEAAVAQREALIDALRRNLELDLARDRDLIELRDRRDKVRLRLADSSALQARVARAEVVATRHLLEYFEVVQRAQLLQGRYAALSARLENLNELIASPAVIFAFANRLARAESRVDRARTLLFDWLVALEYYAVRPFIDQRLAILLARNPSQLEAISNELVRLQNACGGNVNTAIAELSLRDDLLKVGFETEARTGAERFREVLKRGNVPIDTQVRYSTDQRIGDLLRSRKVLAATFTLSLDDFANLPQTCNSKVASLDVQLVGEGLGNARPTVSVLYDGTSTLRSCQPNIRDLVAALDPGTTSFGPLTRFRTKGRSVSPVASINTFGLSDSVNRGLEGLPLASTYTVLIDPEAGENKTVDWSRLEDVKLKLTWAYQDLFPVGQCQ